MDPIGYDLPAEGSHIELSWVADADDRLDAERAKTTERVARLDALRIDVVNLANVAPAEPRRGVPSRHLEPARRMWQPWREIVGQLALEVWNLARQLGGDVDAVLRPQPTRSQPFAGRRHALAAALGHEGAAPLGLGSCMPSPGPGTPPPEGERGIRGERRAIDAIDAQRAIQGARVGTAIDARGRVMSGGRAIPAPHLRLLQLVEWGREHGKAKRRKHGVDLAVEPLRLADAFDVVKREHAEHPDCPKTLHEASLAYRRARSAVEVALLERQLVPPPRLRQRAESLAPTLASESP